MSLFRERAVGTLPAEENKIQDILTTLDNLCAGDFSARVKLSETDSLYPVVQKINMLADIHGYDRNSYVGMQEGQDLNTRLGWEVFAQVSSI